MKLIGVGVPYECVGVPGAFASIMITSATSLAAQLRDGLDSLHPALERRQEIDLRGVGVGRDALEHLFDEVLLVRVGERGSHLSWIFVYSSCGKCLFFNGLFRLLQNK